MTTTDTPTDAEIAEMHIGELRDLVRLQRERLLELEREATPSEGKGEWVLPKFNGPDADGLYWLHFSAAKLHASINIRSGGIVERCIRAWLAAAPPASVPDKAAVEREACAKLAEEWAAAQSDGGGLGVHIARAIRARGSHHNPATKQKEAQR